jgi:hypothetical protein
LLWELSEGLSWASVYFVTDEDPPGNRPPWDPAVTAVLRIIAVTLVQTTLVRVFR